MKLYDSKGSPLRCSNCKPPKLSMHGGRRWVALKKYLDGEYIEFWYEERRGSLQMYFEREGKWYKTLTEEILHLKTLYTSPQAIQRNRKKRGKPKRVIRDVKQLVKKE